VLITPQAIPAHCAGADKLPLLSLVGKGVCFDTGGLDIKTAAGMKLMKKVGPHALLSLAPPYPPFCHSPHSAIVRVLHASALEQEMHTACAPYSCCPQGLFINAQNPHTHTRLAVTNSTCLRCMRVLAGYGRGCLSARPGARYHVRAAACEAAGASASS